MRIVFGSTVVMLAAVTTLLGCTDPKTETAADTVTIVKETQAAWVRNFNPLVAPSLSRWPTTCGIYEPLMIFNVMEDRYVPWLAENYTLSDDNLELRFELREGVRWSDGAPFRASDVVFTFELLRAHRALDLEAVWTFLASVAAPDERTVVFRFRRPFVPGLVYLAHQPIVPEHAWRDVANPVTYANEHPVGTGPFTEVRQFREQVFVLGRNPYYWMKDAPAVDALRFPAYSGNDQANLALIHGEVDWSGNFVPAVERTFVAKNPEHRSYWFPLVGNMAMLYTNNSHPVLASAAVRKALSRAIDRSLVAEVAMYGYTRPADATALSDAYAHWRVPAVLAEDDWTRYDPHRAAEELDQLGYVRDEDGRRHLPSGEPMTFELLVITGWSDWIRAAQIVARQLAELGIDVRIVTYDRPTWFDRMQRGTFDLAIGWTVQGPTPYIFYRGLMSSDQYAAVGQPAPLNWHRFSDPTLDAVFDGFERAGDRAEQERLALEMQRAFVRHAPSLPLFPNPPWGTYNDERIVGFPDADDPYAKLTPNDYTQPLLVLTRLRPRSKP